IASVGIDELVLTDQNQEITLDLPANLTYVSVAPYVTQTHDCFYHSLTTCRGELDSEPVEVTFTDETTGETLVDEQTTTFDNGFIGFWVPRDTTGTIEATHEGRTGTTEFSTADDGATCVTDLRLTWPPSISLFQKGPSPVSQGFSRRQLLLGGLMLAGSGALAACGNGTNSPAAVSSSSAPRPYPTPTNLAEPTVRKTLTARPMSIDIGGIEANTWGYIADSGEPAIEATAGDVLQIDITNELPEDTSIHWHGIALHNAADGVPGMTQPPIAPGDSYSYVFEVPHGGTYFYHSHSGLQLDRGLHAPLIIRDPEDADDQDVEWTIVLDDWIDGITGTPDDQLAT